MEKLRNKPIYIVILCLLLALTACQKKEEKSSQKKSKDEFKVLEYPLEELEGGLIQVMSKTDLIPYFEKQIAAKKQQEEEQKQTTPPATGGSSGGKPSAPSPQKKFTPEPASITDTLLSEIVKVEKPKKEKGKGQEKKEEEAIPEKITFSWDEINTNISKLHEQWNELKPKLSTAKVPETALTEFGDALNALTIAGTTKQVMETLIQANQASRSFGEFMKVSKDQALSPLYFVRYYNREIVLSAANHNDTKATQSFQDLRRQADALSLQLVEKKAKDNADKLKSAVEDLESALRSKDLNLLKVKASVVARNISSIKEKLGEE